MDGQVLRADDVGGWPRTPRHRRRGLLERDEWLRPQLGERPRHGVGVTTAVEACGNGVERGDPPVVDEDAGAEVGPVVVVDPRRGQVAGRGTGAGPVPVEGQRAQEDEMGDHGVITGLGDHRPVAGVPDRRDRTLGGVENLCTRPASPRRSESGPGSSPWPGRSRAREGTPRAARPPATRSQHHAPRTSTAVAGRSGTLGDSSGPVRVCNLPWNGPSGTRGPADAPLGRSVPGGEGRPKIPRTQEKSSVIGSLDPGEGGVPGRTVEVVHAPTGHRRRETAPGTGAETMGTREVHRL